MSVVDSGQGGCCDKGLHTEVVGVVTLHVCELKSATCLLLLLESELLQFTNIVEKGFI